VAIAAKFGKWTELTLGRESTPAEIKKIHTLIPTRSYRQQVMHHCATMRINKALYVESSMRGIVYVVVVNFSDQLLWDYEDFINEHMKPITQVFHETGIDSDLGPIREVFSTLDAGWAVDDDTYVLQFALWKALDLMAQNNPVPALKRILPALVNAWNNLKGNSSEYFELFRFVPFLLQLFTQMLP
jgi:hypothetical protein